MKKRTCQYNFSRKNPAVYNQAEREEKARRMLIILDNFYNGKLKDFSVLDIGCSTGIITNYLARRFKRTVGVDIDKSAIKFAQEQPHQKNASFKIGNGMKLEFPNASFGIIICNHVYEHVPDSSKLISEIHRLLKPDGVCYFAATNRLNFIEPHYKLPFLSVFPRPISHLYLKLFKRVPCYYEKPLSYWGLKKLARQFKIIDYTPKIIKNPQKFGYETVIQPHTFKAKIAFVISNFTIWLSPTFIWLLQK